MKFFVFSDLHLEFLNKKEIDLLLGRLAKTKDEVDICLVVGDIHPVKYNEYLYFQNWLARNFKQSYVIFGNHEYYRSSINTINNELNYLDSRYTNVTFLYNYPIQHIEIDNIEYAIGGTTLWFEDHPDNIFNSNSINCFKCISDLSTRVYDENKKAIEFIKYFNNKCIANKKILLTHYLPFNRSVNDKYKNSNINNFYVCDLSKHLNDLNFDLIVHGHSHDSCDYQIGNTRVVCNPYGYNHQNKEFDFNKIIEV